MLYLRRRKKKSEKSHQGKMTTRNIAQIISIDLVGIGTRNHCQLNDSSDKTKRCHSKCDKVDLIQRQGCKLWDQGSVLFRCLRHRKNRMRITTLVKQIMTCVCKYLPPRSHHQRRDKPPPLLNGKRNSFIHRIRSFTLIILIH